LISLQKLTSVEVKFLVLIKNLPNNSKLAFEKLSFPSTTHINYQILNFKKEILNLLKGNLNKKSTIFSDFYKIGLTNTPILTGMFEIRENTVRSKQMKT